MSKSAKRKAHDAAKRNEVANFVIQDARPRTWDAKDPWALPNPHVDRLTMIMGAQSCRDLLPRMEEIPDEFKDRYARLKWNQLVYDWFHSGMEMIAITVKPHINREAAFRHLGAVLGSFEPKHKHKMAGCAYLASKWFLDYTPVEAWEDNCFNIPEDLK